MNMHISVTTSVRPRTKRAFSLAELLVTVGVIGLLVAIMLPPLQLARRQAMQTRCSAQLQQLGLALQSAHSDHNFYPLWDDGCEPIRFTWIDVLAQQRFLGTSGDPYTPAGEGERPRSPAGNLRIGYCPADELPDPLNEARHHNLMYPLDRSRTGVDYSYGIGVPLSAGGWAWRPGYTDDPRPRRFGDHVRHPSGRVLAGDATMARIYNLSGRAVTSGVWNDLTQYDNTVAWGRHATGTGKWSANLLFQDGHVSSVRFEPGQPTPVNTMRYFTWLPGEPLHVDAEHEHEGNWYPYVPPPSFQSNPQGDVFPDELLPYWYTANELWTLIAHK